MRAFDCKSSLFLIILLYFKVLVSVANVTDEQAFPSSEKIFFRYFQSMPCRIFMAELMKYQFVLAASIFFSDNKSKSFITTSLYTKIDRTQQIYCLRKKCVRKTTDNLNQLSLKLRLLFFIGLAKEADLPCEDKAKYCTLWGQRNFCYISFVYYTCRKTCIVCDNKW